MGKTMTDHTPTQLDLLAAARQAGFDQGMERIMTLFAQKAEDLMSERAKNADADDTRGYDLRDYVAAIRDEIDPPKGAAG